MENGVKSFVLGCCEDEWIQLAVGSVDVVCKVEMAEVAEKTFGDHCGRDKLGFFYMSKVCGFVGAQRERERAAADFQLSMCGIP